MKRRSAAVAIAVTIGQLCAGRLSGWSADQELVLSAFRRAMGMAGDAPEEELAARLAGFSSEQMRGVVSNVKGVFHEMLVARAENMDDDPIRAELFEAINHPGADLEFTLDGEVISCVQVKAAQAPGEIVEHFARYPDVDVLATSEVTAVLQGMFGERVADSGFSNEEITYMTRETLRELAGDGCGDFLDDAWQGSALLAGALQARALLSADAARVRQARSHLEAAGVGLGTALAVDTVLNLL